LNKPGHILFIFTLWVLLALQACKKDEAIIETPELGYEYYPLQLGSYWIYEVDSIVYDDFKQSIDTFRYQLMEFVESDFLDQENRLNYRIERHKRANIEAPWKIADACFVCRTNNRLEKTTNNLKIIPLIFPVREGLSWNGNAFNMNEVWNFKYETINKKNIINGLSFDSSLTVIQRDEFNLIETQHYKELYAKHVGLISIKIDDFETEVKGKIKSGVKYSQNIIEYGVKN